MDYDTLFKTVQAYVENDFPDTEGTGDLTSEEQIDTFITQAEQRIYNTVQLLDLRKNVTGNCTADNKYLSAPSDWLANFSMAVVDPVTDEYTYLLNKDVNYIREAFPFPAVTGKPTHYAMFDKDSYILGPTPDASYVIELHYFYYPESITTVVGGHTWLGDNFDSVLLYGSILEAYTFMKGETDVMTNYQKRYDDAMLMLKTFAEGKNRKTITGRLK
jgi:hypothetical protein